MGGASLTRGETESVSRRGRVPGTLDSLWGFQNRPLPLFSHSPRRRLLANGRTDGPTIRPTARPRGRRPDPSAPRSSPEAPRVVGCPALGGSQELVEAGPDMTPPPRLSRSRPWPGSRACAERMPALLPGGGPGSAGSCAWLASPPLPFDCRRPERKLSRGGQAAQTFPC